ncbi:nucleotidyltransferase family protein [Lederbergia citrea]|uniref:NTP transferase domain-containing protein n=1 Tax=Lederbergia citrea TaxID=2833581 RepID=A0A942UNP4_9BACI|nr:nucleotidyltransferase family protein [Lederbergia citrea]MBS4224045.1 NTP transferase domain-containing protein [Lederbergia citrea]
MNIIGIYLAAGNSRRMGKNKLALPTANGTVGSLALQTALTSSLEKVYVITKHNEPDWLPREMALHEKCNLITCPSAQEGQSESLRCGILQAQKEKANAAIVLLADQPFITNKMIDDMITLMKEEPLIQFVAASYQHITRPPVLFSSFMFPTILEIKGDIGAKNLLRGEFFRHGKMLDFDDEKLFFDVDTVEDYDKLHHFLNGPFN